ncbi:MAG: dihydrodipicolinate synthase family protein [Tepidisphaeraceae bacterium]
MIVPMVSPFTQDGRPDAAAVGRLVDRLIAAGVHGIFVLGTTGEGASIARQDQRELVRATVQAVAGRATTYAGISGNCLQESVDAGAAYRDLGIDALVAHPPFYFPIPERDVEKYFEKLAEAVPLPLVLYNIPKTTHVSIPVDAVRRLSGHRNIAGIKDSAGDLPRLEQLMAAVGADSQFKIFVGSSSLCCAGLRLGAHGLVPSTANFAPQPYVQMYDAAMQGRWDEAAALQKQADELSARYQQGRTLGESIAALKAILAQQGICGATVLPPLHAIAGES